ncbi:hypothetical protein L1887_34359 [Cichorium endivia]|nr:hypothetical protein L1887_34359 [Cichorium endivia]
MKAQRVLDIERQFCPLCFLLINLAIRVSSIRSADCRKEPLLFISEITLQVRINGTTTEETPCLQEP